MLNVHGNNLHKSVKSERSEGSLLFQGYHIFKCKEEMNAKGEHLTIWNLHVFTREGCNEKFMLDVHGNSLHKTLMSERNKGSSLFKGHQILWL